MANRVTATEVRVVAEIDELIISDTDLDTLIGVANRMVTKVIVDADSTEADKANIEKYLGAHFAKLKDQLVKSERAGSVSQEFFGKVGLLLDYTPYGQMAKIIDTSGALAQLDKGKQTTPIFRTLNPDTA